MLRTLMHQGVSVAGLRVLGTGLSVLVTIAIARLFGADALGIYAYCVALLAIAAVPVSNGWSTMILRTVAGYGAIDGEASAMTRMGAQGAVLMALIAGALGYLLVQLVSTPVTLGLRPVALMAMALLTFTLLCNQLSAMRMASMRGIDRPVLGQLPEMLARPALLLLGVVTAWLVFGQSALPQDVARLFMALAIASSLAALSGHLLLLRVARPAVPASVDRSERKAWLASAAALAGSAGLVQLNGYIDMLLLGNFATAQDLGHYRTALQIAMLASFGYVALNMLAGQRFARFRRQDDQAGMRATATWLARLGLAAALPMPLILALFGEHAFSLLFGADFTQAAAPALIISCGLAFSAAIGMARTLLVMHHLEFLVMRTTVAALAINVVLCLVLIPRYGILGAAWANFFATCSWNLLLWLLARRKTGIDSSVLGLSPRMVAQPAGGQR